MQNYNNILDTIELRRPASEPVSISSIKNYLRLEGFIDDDDSTAIPEFEDDNQIIYGMISTAREALEQVLGCSIGVHTWKAIGVTNQAGNVMLKNGPVRAITSIKNEAGTEYATLGSGITVYGTPEIDTVRLTGDYLAYPKDDNMTVEYTAGFAIIPHVLIAEIKRMVAYQYEHRGDETGLEGYKYSSGVYSYRRKEIIN